MVKENPFIKNKNEIFYNLINSAIAGSLIFVGTALDGDITIKGFIAAILTGMLVAITKFKEYWISEKSEYCNKNKIFNFI